MTKVLSLTASQFRGIPGSFSMSFLNPNGEPSSILLLGDNGVGKSSVADAFEFCLRGKVSRRGNAGAKSRREAQNYIVGGTPSVTVSTDSEYFCRGAKPLNFKGIRLRPDQFAPGFALCPVVLSRADIEMFWHLTAVERMRFFFDYLRDSVRHPGYAALEIERVEATTNSVKLRLLEAQIALAAASKRPVVEIPVHDRVSFYEWRGTVFPQYVFPAARNAREAKAARSRALRSVPHRVRQALHGVATELEELHRLHQHLAAKRKEIQHATGAPPIVAPELPKLLAQVSGTVSEDFAQIADLPHVRAVQIISHHSGYELQISCVLSNGRRVAPEHVLSEGSLDLLALLILLAVARVCASRGQKRFLILDDVWQSVDSIHRDAFLSYLFTGDLRKWQFLITVHDRLWARLIENMAQKYNHSLRSVELGDWSEELGPHLRYGTLDTASQLAKIAANSPPEAAVAYAGRALEELADKLSMTLQTSVSRRPGDRYTLEDLWSGVQSALKKPYLPARLRDVVDKINETYVLRNTYGAHYNLHAESISVAESRRFVALVVELWQLTHCGECGTPIGLIVQGKNRKFGRPCSHPALPATALADAGQGG